MSSILNKIKEKTTGKSGASPPPNHDNEPTFSILPVPGPNDPHNKHGHGHGQVTGGGLATSPNVQALNAFHATGPLVPSQEMLNNVEQPKSREELRARQAELNRKD